MKRYHVSENKFDKSTAALNKRVTTSGTTDYTGAFASDYIPISENVNCTITGLITTVVTVIYFYDSSNTNIGYISADSSSSYSFITPNGTAKLRFTGDMNYINTASVITYTWQTKSPLKYGTASEIITPPTTIYADGTAISTYSIKGNTVQSGTPTPSNPVDVNGVGEKTANLIFKTIPSANINASGQIVNDASSEFDLFVAKISQDTAYSGNGWVYAFYSTEPSVGSTSYNSTRYAQTPTNVTAPIDGYIVMRANHNTQTAMLNEGATAKPYEPSGYKIPISTGGVTTPIYLNEPLMKLDTTSDTVNSSGEVTRIIARYEITGTEQWRDANNPIENTYCYRFSPTGIIDVGQSIPLDSVCTHFQCGAYFNSNEIGYQHTNDRLYFRVTQSTVESFKQWLADLYAAGTPVTVCYILATPTTETVTAPSIPTTEGANSITVDTTVQPSEFTATWTGWHDSSVKEYDGTNWQ